MTEEEKQLLLQDLSARLPYGVKCYAYQYKIDGNHCECYGILDGILNGYFYLRDRVSVNGGKTYDICYLEIKPYLRPMSSMTKEEEDEWCDLNIDPLLEAVGERHTRIEDLMLRAKSQYNPTDWLNAHHFDYRGLISMGLAIEVTSENNP